MKRIVATGAVAALAMVGFAGTASAGPPMDKACVGKIVSFHAKALGGPMDGVAQYSQGFCAGELTNPHEN